MKKGWELKKINDVCEIGDGNHGGNYPKKIDMRDFGVPFIRSVNLVNGEVSAEDLKYISEEKHKSLNKGHLKTGDVLFTNRGDIGKCAIVGSEFDDANLNSQIAFFRCSSSLYNRYLYYFLLSPNLQNYLYASKTGSALQQFPIGLIVKIKIPIPPLPEQQRIVSMLDEAFASIAQAKSNAERNLVNARELFESVLNEIFESGKKHPPMVSLGELTDLSRGYNPPKSKFSNTPKEGYVRFYQIRDGWNDEYAVYVPDSPQIHKVNEDDILMVAYRHIGRVFRGVSGAFNVALCKIQNTRRDLLDDEFLFYLVPTKYIKGELLKRSERSLIPSMSLEHLKEIQIPLPPLAEQRSIVGRLEALSAETGRLEEIYQQKVESLEELKKSVLQKAFNGEL